MALKDEMIEILSHAKPKGTPNTKEAAQDSVDSHSQTTINITKCNLGNAQIKSITVILSIALISIMAILLHPYYLVNSNRIDTGVAIKSVITKQQGDEISSFVRIVSKCEKKHYFDIYDDVRKITKTLHYRDMDTIAFRSVREMLINRFCEIEKTKD